MHVVVAANAHGTRIVAGRSGGVKFVTGDTTGIQGIPSDGGTPALGPAFASWRHVATLQLPFWVP